MSLIDSYIESLINSITNNQVYLQPIDNISVSDNSFHLKLSVSWLIKVLSIP